MKKFNFLLIILLATTTVLSSCNKAKRIERNLWKNGGEWNIVRLVSKQTSTNSADNFEETINNYGSFNFNENGSGSYAITVDGGNDTGTLTYSNSEEELTLIIDSQARVFDIVEWKKNEMTISITENYTSSGESITYTETMELEKQ